MSSNSEFQETILPHDVDERVDAASRALGVEFQRRALLRLALVHRSYLNELGVDSDDASTTSNERLEFLGDAILGMITAEFLYLRFPSLPEGQLTSYRTALVRTETLASWARRFGLENYLFLGRGEIVSDREVRDRILAGAFEAVIAAIYLDRGLDETRDFLRLLLLADADTIISARQETNYKGRLQELIQDRERVTPEYRTLSVEGPAHERMFTVEVVVHDEQIGVGSGSSKRLAQQEAARDALNRLATEESIDRDE